jgi:integrase
VPGLLAGSRRRPRPGSFLLGFAGALRRSELVGLDIEHVTWTGDGLKLLTRALQDGRARCAAIAIPHGRADDTCPPSKPGCRGVVERARLSTDAVRQILLKHAAKAGLGGTLAEPFSPHGLRAGFVTTAYRNGVPDEEIMGHTQHRSL